MPKPVDMGDTHGTDDFINRKSPKKGNQDPMADAGKGLQDRLKDIPKKEAAKVEDKKKGQDTGKAANMASNVKGQPDRQKPKQKPGEGSGAVVKGDSKGDDKGQVVIEEYDPAAGLFKNRFV
jgi:hypothetical protein